MKAIKKYALIKTVIACCMLVCAVAVHAQSSAGITQQRDTSYSTWTAYTSTLKTHPAITIVSVTNNPSVIAKKNITYCAVGQRALLTDVFYPAKKSAKRRTAIVFIHGGGWRSGNRTQHHPLAQELANRGYVCFTPEYRLSTEALYPAAVYDCKAVLQWVRANAGEYQIDTNKIVIAGFSAGGELAAFLGATATDPSWNNKNCSKEFAALVNAVIDIDGTLSFVHPDSHEGNDSVRTSAATYWFGYPKKDNPALWAAASPLAHVQQQTAPILFINSSVPWMHAGREDFIAVLQQHQVYSEVKYFEGAPHLFCLFEPWFTPTINYIDSFLQKVLR